MYIPASTELTVILITILLFGPQKLPELARTRKAVAEYKRAAREIEREEIGFRLDSRHVHEGNQKMPEESNSAFLKKIKW